MTGRHWASVVALAAVVGLSSLCARVRGDVINNPPHPHNPSPVTTWAHDILPNGDPDPSHRHQHRTAHDPMAGVHVYGTGTGAEAYKANTPGQVWVGRVLTVQGGTHGGNNEAEHGHQGHEIDFGRFHVHPAIAGGDISQAEADAWNANINVMAAFAAQAWNVAGTASGAHNWPSTDADIDDDTVFDPNGVPWHSSVDWRQASDGAHELHIVYGEAGGARLANTFIPAAGGPGTFPGGHWTEEEIIMDDDQPWSYTTPTATEYDFATILLHEWGHVVGLDHFGAGNLSYIMRPNFNFGEMTRTIDPDAVHGVRDLYAIPVVPEPSSVAVLGTIGFFCRRRRRSAPPAP
jgi:hypothetical protein